MLTVSGDNLFLRAEITCPAVLNSLSDDTDEPEMLRQYLALLANSGYC